MIEEMKKTYNPFKMWGSWTGLIFVLLFIPMFNYQNDWSRKEYAWERYNLCKQCGEPRNLSCVIKLCEVEANKISNEDLNFMHLTKQSYVNTSCASHPDIEYNHPEAFINGFCGYKLWRGFDYGEKPNKILTYFSLHNFKESFSGMTIIEPILKFLLLIFSFLVGWGIHSLIRKYKN